MSPLSDLTCRKCNAYHQANICFTKYDSRCFVYTHGTVVNIIMYFLPSKDDISTAATGVAEVLNSISRELSQQHLADKVYFAYTDYA